MKIKIIMRPKPKTFGEWATEHDLTMHVVEREHWLEKGVPQFYAEFEHAEVKIGAILHGYYGNGGTVDKAILDYIDRIEGHVLVINATSAKNRREIYVPMDMKREWQSE